jgi:hypothetical protein
MSGGSAQQEGSRVSVEYRVAPRGPAVMLGFVFFGGLDPLEDRRSNSRSRHLWWSGEAAMTSRTSWADVLGSKVP